MDVILPDQLEHVMPDLAVAQQPTAGTAEAPSELARVSQQLRALNSLNTRLIRMEADQPIYGEMVAGVARVLDIDACALYLFEPASQQLLLEGVHGAEVDPAFRRLDLDRLDRPAVQAYLEEYLIHMHDLQDVPGANPVLEDARSLLALPIIGREGAVGAFVFAQREANRFGPEALDLASMLVDQMAYQLENYRLVRQLSTSRDAVIHGMARLAESRGGDLGGHIDRICAYSQLLGARLQGTPGFLGRVTPEWVATLTRASALHDIGKVAIPDAILLKPGRLDENEFGIMRTHARLGADILRDLMATHGSFPMLEMGLEVALAHHERWDGTGYPSGLAREDIPLSARIVAVADVYDALMSKRVYKAPWSQDETLTELRRQAGRQFDPRLVEAFLQEPRGLEQIAMRFPD